MVLCALFFKMFTMTCVLSYCYRLVMEKGKKEAKEEKQKSTVQDKH